MKKGNEGRFIPCGDSLERMDELREEQMENVSGGCEISDMPDRQQGISHADAAAGN